MSCGRKAPKIRPPLRSAPPEASPEPSLSAGPELSFAQTLGAVRIPRSSVDPLTIGEQEEIGRGVFGIVVDDPALQATLDPGMSPGNLHLHDDGSCGARRVRRSLQVASLQGTVRNGWSGQDLQAVPGMPTSEGEQRLTGSNIVPADGRPTIPLELRFVTGRAPFYVDGPHEKRVVVIASALS